MGGVAQGIAGDIDPLNNINAGMGANFAEGVSEPALDAARKAANMSQLRMGNATSRLGSATTDESGNIRMQLSPEYQALADQYLQSAGVFSGQAQQALSALGAFDPNQATQDEFSRLEQFLAPLREQQRSATEQRLFAQGRLGSTGGALDQRALEEAIAQQQLANLIQASNSAQQRQMNLVNMAGGLFGQGLQGGNAAAGLQQLPQGLFQSALGLAQAKAGAGSAAGSFLANQGLQQTSIASGYGMQERKMQHEVGMKFLGGGMGGM